MYAKLYASLLRSSIWVEDPAVRVLWITLLLASDREGYVWGSPVGLAKEAALPLEQTKAGLEKFLAPDPESSNPDNEGRRIEVVKGGWHILNYAHYREMRTEDDRRADDRERQRRHRASRSVTDVAASHPSESESESESKSKKKKRERSRDGDLFEKPARGPDRPESPEEVIAYFEDEEEAPRDWALAFLAHYESIGWKVGRNPMKNWRAAASGWALRNRKSGMR